MRLGPRTSEPTQAAAFDPPTQRSHPVVCELPATGTWVSRADLALEHTPEASMESAEFPSFCAAKSCSDSCTELLQLRSENRELRVIREKLRASLQDQVSQSLDAEKRRIKLQAAMERKTAHWEKAEGDRNAREREYREAALQHIARLEHRSRQYRRELEKLRLCLGSLESQSQAIFLESQAQIAQLQNKLDQQTIQPETIEERVRAFHLPKRSLGRKPKHGLRRQELIAERNRKSPHTEQGEVSALDKREEFLQVLKTRLDALAERVPVFVPADILVPTSRDAEEERSGADEPSVEQPPNHLTELVAQQERELDHLRIRLQERELELSLVRGEPRRSIRSPEPILPWDTSEDEEAIAHSWVEPDTGLTRQLPALPSQQKTKERLEPLDFDEHYEDPIPVVSIGPTGGLVVEVELTLTTESNFYAGLSLDISLGGIFVATYHLRPLGTAADIKVSFTDGTSFSANGEVKWTRAPGDESSPGMGIQLRNLDVEALETIACYRSKRLPMYFDVEES